jgi:hypothetical protein
VVSLAVTWHRFGLAEPSRRRLAWSCGWVVAATAVALVRASSEWAAHLCALGAVVAALALVWWLVRRGGITRVAPVVGVASVGLLLLQHAFYPALPSPQRNAPTSLSDYQDQAPGAVGDTFEVGAMDETMRGDPAAARDLLLASGWYLNPHRVQNTYTAISEQSYKARYCMVYTGDTCSGALATLFSKEPTTGLERVDLLGVSSLVLVRAEYPADQLTHPPAGWRVAGRTAYSVTWTRSSPLPGAGGVAWTSPGTSVSDVQPDETTTTFRLDHVPAAGGTVVLSLLDWPGYSTSAGSVADPVDGYLLTLHVPASASGQTVDVAFHPPGWWAELGAWVLALVVGAAWSTAERVRRSRRRHAGVTAASGSSPA